MNLEIHNLIHRKNKMAEKQKKTTFEANPLDVNIVKMQYSLIKRFEREVPENGDFAPVYEEYTSKDPTLNLSNVKICCKYVNDDSLKKDKRCLEICCENKAHTDKKTKVIIQGTKKEVFDYLNKTDFFNACKAIAKK